MTVLADVVAYLVRIAPGAVCKDCLARAIGMDPGSGDDPAQGLEGRPFFDRRVDICTECGRTDRVVGRTDTVVGQTG